MLSGQYQPLLPFIQPSKRAKPASASASASVMSDSIFEIREYLDSDGKVNSHDVTDISKELEYMEKLVNSMQENPTALSVRKQHSYFVSYLLN